jgi:hypothetical protein
MLSFSCLLASLDVVNEQRVSELRCKKTDHRFPSYVEMKECPEIDSLNEFT